MSFSHPPRRLVIATIAVLTAGVSATPAVAAAHPPGAPTGPTPAQLKKLESTPLGAAIEQQSKLIQSNIETGTPALDREAVTKLTANHAACETAAAAVAAVAAKPGGREPEIKREWLKGVRLLAVGDRQLAGYYRAYAKGEESKAELRTAIGNLGFGDGLTGWAFNALTGNPGPLPTRHPAR